MCRIEPRLLAAVYFLRHGASAVKPVLQALLVADRVYEDKATGKKMIVGTFSRMHFQQKKMTAGEAFQIPVVGLQAGSPFAYISITDVHGVADLVVRYVRLDAEDETRQEPIFCTNTISVKCEDRLATVELIVPLPMLPMVAGVFALEVMCEGGILGAHRIVVEDKSEDK
jgi:hypothetical protein